MSKVFTQEIIKLLAIAGIVTVSLTGLLGAYIAKIMGSIAPYRKATAIYILLFTLTFALMGFIGIRLTFRIPLIAFIACQLIFLMLGFWHLRLMHKYLGWTGTDKSYWLELLFTVILGGFGFMAYLVVFKWMNDSGFHYLMSASICMFPCAFFIYHCFAKAIAIPMKIYKKWFYPVHAEMADPDESKLKNMLVISFEFQKKLEDRHYTNFRSKAPVDMDYGQLFYYFINDYNERHPTERIEYVDEHAQPYGWIFYKKPKWYTFGTHYIDPDSTFYMNRVKENDILVCTRI